MRKNGFTLIELLAVIVILAIIALIATPIILGIINDAREKANERSVELYAAAVKNGIAAYQLREGKEVTPKTYTKDTLPFEVEYDGKVDCESVIISENGKVSLDKCTVNGGTKEYSYGIEEESDVAKVCELSDEDSNGKYSVGDIVTCTFKESTEQFYVIENEHEDSTPQTVDMLAMYNLNVGDNPYKDGKIGVQNGKVIGNISGGDSVGMVRFSLNSNNYWDSSVSDYPANVYDEGNDLVKPIVDEYVSYLNEYLTQEAIGSLLTLSQVENLGCITYKDEYFCAPNVDDSNRSGNAPSWLYSISYWLGTAINQKSVYIVGDDGTLYDIEIIYRDFMCGVRPVITISTSDIQ